MGNSSTQRLIVDYEMEIFGDEASLEAIAEVSTLGDDAHTVSTAARRRLQQVQDCSAVTRALAPDDSIPVLSERASPEEFARNNIEEELPDEENTAIQQLGIQRVPHDQWRKVKTTKGLLAWLPTLINSELEKVQSPAKSNSTRSNGGQAMEFSNAPVVPSFAEPLLKPTWLRINSSRLLSALRTVCGTNLTA